MSRGKYEFSSDFFGMGLLCWAFWASASWGDVASWGALRLARGVRQPQSERHCILFQMGERELNCGEESREARNALAKSPL